MKFLEYEFSIEEVADIYKRIGDKVNKRRNEIWLALVVTRELINEWYNHIVDFSSQLSAKDKSEIIYYVYRRKFNPVLEEYGAVLNDLEKIEKEKFAGKKRQLDELLSQYQKTLYDEKQRWLIDEGNKFSEISLHDWLERLDYKRSEISTLIGSILHDMDYNPSDTKKILKDYYDSTN